ATVVKELYRDFSTHPFDAAVAWAVPGALLNVQEGRRGEGVWAKGKRVIATDVWIWFGELGHLLHSLLMRPLSSLENLRTPLKAWRTGSAPRPLPITIFRALRDGLNLDRIEKEAA